MSKNIRDYKIGDEKIVKSILKAGLKPYELDVDFETTDADITNIQASYISTGGLFRILESNEGPIGMYGIYTITDSCCELRKMYLLPGYKGEGLGRLLLCDAFEQAKNKGFKEMILETNLCLIEAVAMYKKYGFDKYQPAHLSKRCDCGMRRPL